MRILDVYGYAIGVIGLRVDDFLLMYVDEYEAVLRSYREAREQEYRDGWERMRMNASVCVQPHVRKKMSPKDIMRFPWDNEHRNKKPLPTREEAMAEYRNLMERIGGS